MSEDHTLCDAIRKHSKLPSERVRICRHPDRFEVGAFEGAVIFIYAAWSGPATWAFQHVTSALADSESMATIWGYDTDDFTAPNPLIETFEQMGAKMGGWGESLWIRKGQVVGALGKGQTGDIGAIEALVQKLLE